jgi:hypothetical protein
VALAPAGRALLPASIETITLLACSALSEPDVQLSYFHQLWLRNKPSTQDIRRIFLPNTNTPQVLSLVPPTTCYPHHQPIPPNIPQHRATLSPASACLPRPPLTNDPIDSVTSLKNIQQHKHQSFPPISAQSVMPNPASCKQSRSATRAPLNPATR